MKKRLVILTELIAPYRIPVFNALAQRPEIDLHVVFFSRTDESMRQWRIYEDEIRFSFQVLPNWRRRIGRYNILLNRGLAGTLQAASPDVIVCGGYNYLSSWQAQYWARAHRVPFLLWSESTGGDQRSRKPFVETLKKKFLAGCDAFIVPGEAAKQYLASLHIPSENIHLAPNAVDIALFAALERGVHSREPELRALLALPDRYFLFVGRLIYEKGVFDLLDAYGSLPPVLRQEVGLVYAGDGPARAELESRAREIYPGTVQFAGFIDRDGLPAYYTLAECLVLPTHSDTWGLVVNEAMACGLPIICSEIAGCAADLVRNNGKLVSPNQVRELAAAMEMMAADSSLRLQMAAESRKLIQTFSPENCAAGLAGASTHYNYVQ